MTLARILRILSANFHGSAVCLSLGFLPVCPTTAFHSGERKPTAFCKGRIFHEVFVVGVNCRLECLKSLVAFEFAFPGISAAGRHRCEQHDRNDTGRNVFDFVCWQFGIPFSLQLLVNSIPSSTFCEIEQELQSLQRVEFVFLQPCICLGQARSSRQGIIAHGQDCQCMYSFIPQKLSCNNPQPAVRTIPLTTCSRFSVRLVGDTL